MRETELSARSGAHVPHTYSKPIISKTEARARKSCCTFFVRFFATNQVRSDFTWDIVASYQIIIVLKIFVYDILGTSSVQLAEA